MSDVGAAFGLKLLHQCALEDVVDDQVEGGGDAQQVVINGRPFIGHFRLEAHENFDEFLKAIG